MKKIAVVLLTILMLFSLFRVPLREDVVRADSQPIWPMFHFNVQHTGQSPYNSSKNSGILKWKYETGLEIDSSPAIGSDGTIYIGSGDKYFYALNPDGSLKWKYETGEYIDSSPAIASDGIVYVGVGGVYFYALNPDGSLKWRYEMGFSITYSSPAIASDGTVYVADFEGSLYALNPDGSLKWKFKTGPSAFVSSSSPAIGSDGTIYIGSGDNYLYAINPDGTLKWRYQTGGHICSSPAIGTDGSIYVGSYDNYFYAINPNGTLKWRYQTGGHIYSSPAIDYNGTVYVGSGDGYVYAIGINTYTITVLIGTDGSISPSGTMSVNSGDSQTFTITPNTGYKIRDVKVDGVSVGTVSTYTLTNITSDHTIEATFEPIIFTITSSAGTGGSISPSGTVLVNYGDSKTFTIIPNSGFKISDVKVDGSSVGAVSSYTFSNITSNHTIEATFEKEITQTVIILQIGNLTFTVNGITNTLDSPPVIKNSRTLLPIRAVVEALGGTVGWDATEKKVTVTLGSNTIELWIGKPTGKVNGVDTPIDSTNSKVVPEIINSRTMLPLRFVTENLGCDVQWDGTTKTITIKYRE